MRGHPEVMDSDAVTVLEEPQVYRGFFSLKKFLLHHRHFDGSRSKPLTRELLERGAATAILLYDPQRDAVVLIEQFRVGALRAAGGAWLIEVVAGVLGDEHDSEAVARRESLEEAGCRVGRIEKICDYLVSPGGTSEQITLYCGEVRSDDIGGLFGLDEEGEDIHAFVLPFATAWAWLEQGEINSASPIIALQWLKLHRPRLQQQWLYTQEP
ncbi:MAG: NUDIX domain-containing protein [Gammaproteobacteria bacterium]|nr:NUDIX domain-containing protein [Gammaproteobacteria bacterium]